MIFFLDTSVLVAGLAQYHPFHARAADWLMRARDGQLSWAVSAHSLAEVYASLTSIPYRPRVSPAMAMEAINDCLATGANVVSLSAPEYVAVLARMAQLNISGGTIYDALIAYAAQKANADRLLTLNPTHFKRVWPEGADKIAAP